MENQATVLLLSSTVSAAIFYFLLRFLAYLPFRKNVSEASNSLCSFIYLVFCGLMMSGAISANSEDIGIAFGLYLFFGAMPVFGIFYGKMAKDARENPAPQFNENQADSSGDLESRCLTAKGRPKIVGRRKIILITATLVTGLTAGSVLLAVLPSAALFATLVGFGIGNVGARVTFLLMPSMKQ